MAKHKVSPSCQLPALTFRSLFISGGLWEHASYLADTKLNTTSRKPSVHI